MTIAIALGVLWAVREWLLIATNSGKYGYPEDAGR